MNPINHLDLLDNKEYIYVLSTEYNSGYEDGNDLSIFETEEWEHLLELSKTFERAVINLNYDSDYSYTMTGEKIKNASYYFYYSPFSMYKGLSDLESKDATKTEIYEKVFELVKEGEGGKITIDKFREWIIKNYDSIKDNYELIKDKN